MRIGHIFVTGGGLALAASLASAGSYSFAGFSFDQTRTTDTLGLLGDNANLGGAQFSANYARRITGSVAFVADSIGSGGVITGQAGFDDSLSIGRQAYAQHSITQDGGAPNGTNNSHYASAINLPNNNDGSGSAARRHGLEMSWAGNRALANGAGADFLVYESASSPGAQEAFMIRARNATTGEWSDWWYQDSDGFENYLGEASEGAHAYAYDMSNLGFSVGDLIDAVQLANLMDTDRLDGSSTAGTVNFNGVGVAAQYDDNGLTNFGDGAYDPDPLYAVALGDLVTLGQAIPLPTGGAMALAGLTVIGARRRRSA